MKRAGFLASVALLAMLILVRTTMAQGADGSAAPTPQTTMVNGSVVWMGAAGGGGHMETTMVNGSAAPTTPLKDTGGPDILLPAAAVLLGSGILTYAFLGRR